MERPDLEEVREKYRDVSEVKGLESENVYNLKHPVEEKPYCFSDSSGLLLWTERGGFAEIISYKKPQLEKNTYYKHETERGCTLAYFQGLNKKTYGFSHDGTYIDQAKWFFADVFEDNFGKNGKLLEKATDDEVEKMLTKEAEKQGFVEGAVVRSAYDGKESTIRMSNVKMISSVILVSDKNCSNSVCLFYKGKWADIISKPSERVTLKDTGETTNEPFTFEEAGKIDPKLTPHKENPLVRTNQHFDEVVESTLENIKELLVVKGKEYRRNGNPYHNFDVGAAKEGKTREEVLHGFRLKHEISVGDFRNDIAKGVLPTKAKVIEKFDDILVFYLIEKASMLDRIDNQKD